MSAIVAAALKNGTVLRYAAELPEAKRKVLYVDTEQSPHHCLNVMERIMRMAGLPMTGTTRTLSSLPCGNIRRATHKDCRTGNLPYTDLGMVVIDGIRDMVYDINSPSESTRIISKLMQWTDDRQIHIHTILHQNKGDENARGHIGTELNNKAETVLAGGKGQEQRGYKQCFSMHIRAMDFEPFAFRINDNALPELIEGYRPEAKKPGRPEEEKFDPYRHITEQQHRIALEAAFGLKEEYGYKDLETALVKAYMSVGVKLNHQRRYHLSSCSGTNG